MPKTPAQPIARSPTKVKLSELPRYGPVMYDLLIVLTPDKGGTRSGLVLCSIAFQKQMPRSSATSLSKSTHLRLVV